MSIRLASATAATQGGRRYQEDTALFWDARQALNNSADWTADLPTLPEGEVIAVLGDGMGGHVGGATASRLAADCFLAAFLRSDLATPDRLLAALDTANHALADKVAARPMFRGMGTTLIGAFVRDGALSWVSVGDSALFLWRRGELARLNEDHSMAPEIDRLVAAGRLTEEEAAADPRRHYLRAAVTGDEIELTDVSLKPLALADGDLVLLASDGIHTFDDHQVAAIIGEHITAGPDRVAAALIQAIDDAGARHQDNTTVIAIAVKDSTVGDADLSSAESESHTGEQTF